MPDPTHFYRIRRWGSPRFKEPCRVLAGAGNDDLAGRAYHAGAEQLREELAAELRQALTDLRSGTPTSAILDRLPDNLVMAILARDAREALRRESAAPGAQPSAEEAPDEPIDAGESDRP